MTSIEIEQLENDDMKLQYLIKCRPKNLDDIEKIKYAVSVGLFQKGWTCVGKFASGIYTKNHFVLTLYRETINDEPITASTFISPCTTQCYVNVPNVSWTLEKYNKLYDSGRVQAFWSKVFDDLEEMNEYDSFTEFITKVDDFANMSNLELASKGFVWRSDTDEDGYTYVGSDQDIMTTKYFGSLTDFGPVHAQTFYQILDIVDDPDMGKCFKIQSCFPETGPVELISPELLLHAIQAQVIVSASRVYVDTPKLTLVPVEGTQMAGLPTVIEDINFSMARQELIGQAIKERLFILPLLQTSDSNALIVLKIIKECHEERLLLQLPDNHEMLETILEYARAEYSIWQPLQEDTADAKFELSELLENASYQKQEMLSSYGADITDLMTFLQTSFLSCNPKKGVRANFLYLQALIDQGILKNLCNCLMSESMTDSSKRLLLHEVYTTNEAKNELRSFFYEEGLEDIFEKIWKDYIYVSFDWRHGFGLDCKDYSIERVPTGYRVCNADHGIAGYYLKLNGQVFSYGDLSCMER